MGYNRYLLQMITLDQRQHAGHFSLTDRPSSDRERHTKSWQSATFTEHLPGFRCGWGSPQMTVLSCSQWQRNQACSAWCCQPGDRMLNYTKAMSEKCPVTSDSLTIALNRHLPHNCLCWYRTYGPNKKDSNKTGLTRCQVAFFKTTSQWSKPIHS